jgi:hypothetical protein
VSPVECWLNARRARLLTLLTSVYRAGVHQRWL